MKKFIIFQQSVLIRNGPIRSTSEILAFFKKSPVELSLSKFLRNALVNPFNLRNGLKLIKEEDIDGVKMYFLEKPPRRNTRVDYLALSKGE